MRKKPTGNETYTLTLTQIRDLLRKEEERVRIEETKKWKGHVDRLLDRIAKGQFVQTPDGRLHFEKQGEKR